MTAQKRRPGETAVVLAAVLLVLAAVPQVSAQVGFTRVDWTQYIYGNFPGGRLLFVKC